MTWYSFLYVKNIFIFFESKQFLYDLNSNKSINIYCAKLTSRLLQTNANIETLFFNFKNFSSEFINILSRTNLNRQMNIIQSIKKIDLYHSRKFHDDVLKHFRKYIKDLRWNIFAISVVNELNRCFICIY